MDDYVFDDDIVFEDPPLTPEELAKKDWDKKVHYTIFFMVLLVILLAIGLTFLFLYKPDNDQGSEGSVCVVETNFDSSIPKPDQRVVLTKISQPLSSRYYWCTPTYYAYKLVKNNGKYGPMSDWSLPIIAAPQPPFDSPLFNDGQSDVCEMGAPYMGLLSPLDINYQYNLYRQVGILDLTISGVCIGRIYASSTTVNGQRVYGQVLDIDNPSVYTGVCSGCEYITNQNS